MAHNFRNSRSKQSLCLGSHLLEDRLVLGVELEQASPELLGLAVGERKGEREIAEIIHFYLAEKEDRETNRHSAGTLHLVHLTPPLPK